MERKIKKPRTFSLEETNEDLTAILSFIEEEKAALPYCHIVSRSGVSASGYYDWLKARISNHTLQDWILLGYIKEIYERSRGTYGAPRIHAELALKFNIHCSRKRASRTCARGRDKRRAPSQASRMHQKRS
jgi:hypothetical protein